MLFQQLSPGETVELSGFSPEPFLFRMMGAIQRRQGRWEDSTRNLDA